PACPRTRSQASLEHRPNRGQPESSRRRRSAKRVSVVGSRTAGSCGSCRKAAGPETCALGTAAPSSGASAETASFLSPGRESSEACITGATRAGDAAHPAAARESAGVGAARNTAARKGSVARELEGGRRKTRHCPSQLRHRDWVCGLGRRCNRRATQIPRQARGVFHSCRSKDHRPCGVAGIHRTTGKLGSFRERKTEFFCQPGFVENRGNETSGERNFPAASRFPLSRFLTNRNESCNEHTGEFHNRYR